MEYASRLAVEDWRKIGAMDRDFSDDYKLGARSIAEVFDGFEDLVALARRDKSIRLRGVRKSHKTAVLNAIIAWLIDQPEAERRRVIAQGMDRLNALLALPAREADGEPPEGKAFVREPEPPTRPRRKGTG